MSAQAVAPLQILAFLGTVALVGIGVLATIALALADRRRAATHAAVATAVVIGAYAVALLAVGAAQDDRVLPPGQAKVFCETDCHLAYTVVRTRIVSAGARLLVTLRTHFDARTVAPWRGRAPLRPSPRRVRVVDAAGRAWDIDPAAQRALGASGAAGTPLDTPLRPGESYETTLAFAVPADVAAARLELTEAAPITRLIVGHENSPMHGKTLMALGLGVADGAER